MDDVDKNSKCLSGHMKDWADHYGIRGETKGGAVPLHHELFIITSQYPIEEIWSSQETVKAIRRRFSVTHVVDPFGILPQ